MPPGGSVRSVIVYDHKLVREGLRDLLTRRLARYLRVEFWSWW